MYEKLIKLFLLHVVFPSSSPLSVSFGESFGCLDNIEHEVPFAVSFDELTATCSDRLVDPAWRIRERLTSVGKKAQYDKNLIAEHSFNLIRKRRDQGPQGGKRDLLQWFLDAKDDDGNSLSDEVIKDFILNFTIAGAFFFCLFRIHRWKRLCMWNVIVIDLTLRFDK